MIDRLKVAIVGCGTIARHAHLPAWMGNPRTTVTALCDPSAEALERINGRHPIKCATYKSLGELLAHDKPDVVDVCTSSPYHYALAKEALEAGCHVLLEKPPVYRAEVAEELALLARANQVKLGAVFNYRYRDLVMELKQAADSGQLGDVIKINITHHGPLVFGDAEWLWDEARSKYLLWEFAIHFVDILVHVLGPHSEIIHVLPTVQPGVGHVTDLEVLVRFASGAVGRIEIVADSTRHSSFFTTIDAYGSGMDAFVRWFPPSFRLGSGQLSPFALLANDVKAIWNVGSKILTNQFVKHRNVSHARLIGDYVDWLLDGRDFPLSIERVIPTIQLLAEIEERVPNYRASEAGATASL